MNAVAFKRSKAGETLEKKGLPLPEEINWKQMKEAIAHFAKQF